MAVDLTGDRKNRLTATLKAVWDRPTFVFQKRWRHRSPLSGGIGSINVRG